MNGSNREGYVCLGMIEHSDELNRLLAGDLDPPDLCPYHCTGCGLGFTSCHWGKNTGPLICGECKTAHHFIWTWEDGEQIEAISETPEGEQDE